MGARWQKFGTQEKAINNIGTEERILIISDALNPALWRI